MEASDFTESYISSSDGVVNTVSDQMTGPEITAIISMVHTGVSSPDGNMEEVSDLMLPKDGMIFVSEDDVRKFYERFAEREGFGVSKASVKSIDGEQRYFSFVCSRYGKHTPSGKSIFKPRASVKTGCGAKINVVVQPDKTFKISKVNIDHNHELDPNDSRHLRCFRKVDSVTKRVLERNDQAGIPLAKSFTACVIEAGSHENMSCSKQDCSNYVKKSRNRRLGSDDAQALCSYFVRMHTRNSQFYHVIDYDEECRIRTIFWADARCRASYESFGDVVSFDATYLTNAYEMPFTPFIGINHHGHSVLFGCGLVTHESTQSYIWLFKAWLDCMQGVAPKAIVTDQCKAMQAAVFEVFPDTCYRLCLWHIMNKLPKKLCGYEDYQSIKMCMKSIVYESLTDVEFEERWGRMIEDFRLHGCKWLGFLYRERKRWVPLFVRESFWAGLSTTQRSEGMNAFFKGYLTPSSTLRQFVEQYDNALKSKVEKEVLSDFQSSNSTIPLISDFGFEAQFRLAYTNDILRKVQDEIRCMMYCNVKNAAI